MPTNVGGADRVVRIWLGLLLLPLSYLTLALSGALAVLGYVLGAVALVTGLARFCPAYALFGIDTHTPAGATGERSPGGVAGGERRSL